MTADENPLPCPWCSHEAKDCADDDKAFVGCTMCDARGMCIAIDYERPRALAKALSAAISAWNRVARMREVLEALADYDHDEGHAYDKPRLLEIIKRAREALGKT